MVHVFVSERKKFYTFTPKQLFSPKICFVTSLSLLEWRQLSHSLFIFYNVWVCVLPFLTSLHTVILQVRIFLDKKKTAQYALLGYIFKIRAPKLQNFKNRQNNSYLCKYVSDLIVLLYCFYLFCSFIARQILLISDIQILCSDIQVPQSELK